MPLDEARTLVKLARRRGGARSAGDDDLQLRGRERLGKVVPGPGAHRLEARFHAGIPGNHDDDGTAVRLERGPQQIHSRDGRDVEIDEHDIKARPVEQLQLLYAVPAQRDMEALMLRHRRTALAP